MEFNKRIRNEFLKKKIMSAKDAALFVKDGMTIATSGFTPSGYPKKVPLEIAKRANNGEKIEISLITGASVGDELDGVLAKAGIIKRRYPYQTQNDIRNSINDGNTYYADHHLSHVPQYIDYGYYGKIDIAIVEALFITKDGGMVPTTSVGISPQALKNADKIIVEINVNQPMELEGVHDIYITEKPPHRKPIPLVNTDDRIGKPYMECDIDKIVAIVESNIPDDVRELGCVDKKSQKISNYIIDFLKEEVEKGKLPQNLLPLQSGVGSVANAVFSGLNDSEFENLTCYTEVIQDSMLDLIDSNKVKCISGTSFTLSPNGMKRLLSNTKHYTSHCILRPMEISNNPEVIRRLGVIAINTAIEVDLYANVNSTHIMGTKMMNGIGGSGDFTRNGYLSIFTTLSTAKEGKISSIVPMVSHVDHPEHDVDIVVTEQGIADLRGLSPRERSRKIIKNCAHPLYKELLINYIIKAEKKECKHTPHILEEALSFHKRFVDTGDMKK